MGLKILKPPRKKKGSRLYTFKFMFSDRSRRVEFLDIPNKLKRIRSSKGIKKFSLSFYKLMGKARMLRETEENEKYENT